ncbi:MAG: hypothetical protein EHM59_22240, partial [Betaproteobacteria bacterium]
MAMRAVLRSLGVGEDGSGSCRPEGATGGVAHDPVAAPGRAAPAAAVGWLHRHGYASRRGALTVKPISAQISIYPLRQAHLGPTITTALEALRSRGLDVKTGRMSTVVAGDSEALFEGLKAAFQSAAAL